MKDNDKEPDLFDGRTYPDVPGHQHADTSIAAAAAMTAEAPSLRNRALFEFERSLGLTADEVATRLGESVLTIRPRVCELRRMGKIFDTSERRPNKSGHNAIVWAARR